MPPVLMRFRHNYRARARNVFRKRSIDAKEEPMLGKMLGDAVRPALCV